MGQVVSKSEYCCLIFEDRGYDSFTLTKMMEALSGAKAQIIIATVTMPRDMVDGWTLIRTGD